LSVKYLGNNHMLAFLLFFVFILFVFSEVIVNPLSAKISLSPKWKWPYVSVPLLLASTVPYHFSILLTL